MNQKIKTIAPSKNAFQNMGVLKNCSLKKCISKLLSMVKKDFSLASMNKKFFLQSVSKCKEIFCKKSKKNFIIKKVKIFFMIS